MTTQDIKPVDWQTKVNEVSNLIISSLHTVTGQSNAIEDLSKVLKGRDLVIPYNDWVALGLGGESTPSFVFLDYIEDAKVKLVKRGEYTNEIESVNTHFGQINSLCGMNAVNVTTEIKDVSCRHCIRGFMALIPATEV